MTSHLRATTAVLAALNLVLIALLSLLRTDVDPVTRPIRDYAHGDYSALMLIATIAVGLAAITLAAVVRPLVTGKVAPLGVGLLVFFGVAKLLQGFFPVDTGTAVTTGGLVYNTLDSIAFFILPIAALCIAFTLRSRWSIGLAVAMAAALVLVLAGSEGFGLVQRIFLVLGSGWLLVTALTARSSHPVAA